MANRHRGFTLIEIMVAVSILAFLLLAISPSINDWVVNLRIRNAAGAIERGLQLARQEAIRRNLPISFWLVSASASDSKILDNSCQLSSASGSWVVSARNPAGYCGNDLSVTTAPMLVAKHAVGDGSRSVTLVATGTTATFNGFGSIANSDAISLVAVEAENNCKNYRNLCIELNGLGVARVCDPALDADEDPRGCKSDACASALADCS